MQKNHMHCEYLEHKQCAWKQKKIGSEIKRYAKGPKVFKNGRTKLIIVNNFGTVKTRE